MAEDYTMMTDFEARRRVQEIESSQPKYRMSFHEFQNKHKEDLAELAGKSVTRYV
jgi:hypothetical protein